MHFFETLLIVCFVCTVQLPLSPKGGVENIVFLDLLHMQMHQSV